MWVTVTTSRRQPLALEGAEASSTELAEACGTSVVGEKDGPAIIPARFAPCPTPCRNHGRAGSLDCGGGQLHRLGANVEAVTGIGADLDDVSDVRLAAMLEDIRGAGIECYWWTTYGHEGGDRCRARVLIPFREELPVANPRWWSRVAWGALVKALGLDGAAAADTACRDPARLYYLPRKPSEADARPAGHFEGAPLDWRVVLGDVLDQGAVAAQAFEVAGEPDDARPVDLASVRERLRGVETRAKPLIRAVLAERAPTPPPGKRVPGEVSRYEAWRTVTGALAAVAEDWESSRALLAVLEPAYLAEVRDSPEDYTEWETVEGLLDQARAGMPAYRAQLKAERDALEGLFRRSLRADQAPTVAPPRLEVVASTPTAPAPPEEEWDRGLEFVQRGDDFAIKPIAANLSIILTKSPPWREAFRFNELLQEVEFRGNALRDTDVAAIADEVSRELHVCFPDHVVASRVDLAAQARRYDPVKDYLNGLEWDGVPRAREWLRTYCFAEAATLDGADAARYLRAVGMRWLVSAAARGLQPGCKVDTVLELISPEQGRRKSLAVGVLGGEFASDTKLEIGNNDAFQVAASTWIVELGEMSAFRRSDAEAQKQFLSGRVDKYRAPYGKRPIKTPRHCVFVGTGNRSDYLQDPTGNRRHWPVTVGQIDLEALERDRDQLWAEAVALFRAGEQWHLTPEEEALAAAEAEARMPDDAVAEKVVRYIEELAPDRRPVELSTLDVCQLLGEPAARGCETKVGIAMRRLKWASDRRMEGGRRVTRYHVPAELRSAPRRETVSPVQRMVAIPGGVR